MYASVCVSLFAISLRFRHMSHGIDELGHTYDYDDHQDDSDKVYYHHPYPIHIVSTTTTKTTIV